MIQCHCMSKNVLRDRTEKHRSDFKPPWEKKFMMVGKKRFLRKN